MRLRVVVATFLIAATALTRSLSAAGTSKGREEKFVRPSDVAVDTPQPEYPYEARTNHHEGRGLFRLAVQPNGVVSNVTIAKSTGFAELDESTVKALGRWRFKPGAEKYVEVPVIFEMPSLATLRERQYGHPASYDSVRWKVIPAAKPSPPPSRDRSPHH
jgi:TonB family protein